MNSVTVICECGYCWTTDFNGTEDEAKEYFRGRINVGSGENDKIVTVKEVQWRKVEPLTYRVRYDFNKCQPKWNATYTALFGVNNEGKLVDAFTLLESKQIFGKQNNINPFYLTADWVGSVDHLNMKATR